jgi:arylsulfatase
MQARETLPEQLSRLGYTTAAFTPNPFTSRHFGFQDGFDHFQDFMGEDYRRDALYNRFFEGFLEGDSASSLGRVLLNFWQREEVFKPWTSYYDAILEWVENASEPYFLWVFLMDAHNPYIPNSEHRTQARWKQFHANLQFWRESHETTFDSDVHNRLVTAYTDAVQFSDTFLKRLQSDVSGNPVIAVHGDHGEAFGEHGSYGHEPYLYDENVHVPLVIGNVPSERISTPYSLRNLPALLTNLATSGDTSVEEWYAISKTDQGNQRSVRVGNHALVRNGHEEFFETDHTNSAGEVSPSGEARKPFRKLSDASKVSEREHDRIEAAVREVI